MRVTTVSSCKLRDSFRVQQIVGMFDLPTTDTLETQIDVEVPGLDEEWSIGLIIGPSGSGKSTVARHAFGDAVYCGESWPDDRAMIDCLGEHPIKRITGTLTAVGFSSPPSWIKPYSVLSTGQQFRSNLARAFLRDQPLVVFDEFSSSVCRTVAKTSCIAITKAIHRRRVDKRFVAVTCHDDIAEWLESDWVLNMASGELARGRLQRRHITLKVTGCAPEAWRLFRQHHYLSRTIHRSSQCYLASWNGDPVAFAAVIQAAGRYRVDRVTRVVVLPEYQGIGCGTGLLSAIGQHLRKRDRRLTCTTGHPGMIAALKHCAGWIATRFYEAGTSRGDGKRRAVGRAVASFRYVGSKSIDSGRNQ